MRRWPTLLAAMLLVASVTLPIALAECSARYFAVQNELEVLSALNTRIIRRSKATLDSVKQTLRTLNKYTQTACSPEHIHSMQIMAANNRYTTVIGHVDAEGTVDCTTLGLARAPVKRRSTRYVTPDGFGVIRRVNTRIPGGDPRIVLYLGSYNILINPDHLIDTSIDKTTQLAIVSDYGGVLAQTHEPDPGIVEALVAEPRSGIDGKHIFATQRKEEWTAVAIQPVGVLAPALARQRAFFLPVGALVAGMLATASTIFVRRRFSLTGQLAAAVRRRDFVVCFQPMIDLTSGACIGAEALVRWPRSEAAPIGPDVFIPLAEESSHIFAITDQVIDAVVRDLGAVLQSERSMHISINLCAADLSSGRVLDILDRKLDGTGIARGQIWLEATERGFVDIDSARASIVRAHQKGHFIAIDDFGTGYSSLQYLESLPIDALKIDKSFIATVGRITARSTVLPHIIEIARSLRIMCIAEGVETEDQLEYLRGHGVKYAQGWLFSKALPAEEFIEFFRDRRGEPGRAPGIARGRAGGDRRNATELDEALIQRVENWRVAGALRMAAPLGLGEIVLRPLIADMRDRYPELKVNLVLNDALIDPMEEGVDISLRLGECGTGNFDSMRLGYVRRLLVAAPNYLNVHGTPETPEDLVHHPFLRVSGIFNSGHLQLTFPDQSIGLAPISIVKSLDSWRPLRERLIGGEGIGVLQEPVCADDVASGRLVRLLPALTVPGFELHALYRREKPLPAKIRLTLAFLLDQLPLLVRQR